ncbi:hypothetical protein BC826DRAFT_189688 [Russula brevipes]|nr:hypothetical protein BC826DRAFT_189688 [Russula brevipes]
MVNRERHTMRMLPCISTLAGALLPLLFPYPVIAQTAVSLTNPLPLEVRSPYLNFWTPVPTSDSNISSAEFFFTRAFPGRTALLRIDGVTHSIFGQIPLANQSNVTETQMTLTRTIFSLEVGPVRVSVAFFSPIEPGDLVRQSIPFTYLSFDLQVNDGKAHEIQLYVHIQSGNFFNADTVQNTTWTTISTNKSVYEVTQLQNQQIFSENAKGQAEWGQLYFATAQSNAVTYGVGSADTLINNFSTRGNLNSVPASSSPMQGIGNTTTAFAFSQDLGYVTANASAVFALGFVQDPAIQYVDPTGQTQLRVPYFKTQYPSIGDLIDSVITHYSTASSRSLELETSISNDSATISHDYYSTLLVMATRLVYASTALTIGETSGGVLNSTDVMMFMKNTGAASATNRVNPVEVLYAAFPMFMYLDPNLGGPLLEPLLRHQYSPNSTLPYAVRDAGTLYPNASFNGAPHLQGVEQTANMLIMIYAHNRASGNGTLIKTYFELLRAWTDYLVGSTLYIADQESADGLSINNQTNLAIKGIIAIKAMSLMGAVLENQLVTRISRMRTILNGRSWRWRQTIIYAFNMRTTRRGRWATTCLRYLVADWPHQPRCAYSLVHPKEVWAAQVSPQIFRAHVDFLKTVNITSEPLTSNIARVGIPLDSLRIKNVTYSSNMFAAGFADAKLQRLILSGLESHPLAEDVSVDNTTFTVSPPSPDLGSAYAPLVLTVPSHNTVANVSHSSSTGRKLGIAFGSLFGGAFLAGLLFSLYLSFYRRRHGQPSFWQLYRGHRRTRNGSMVGTRDSMTLGLVSSLGVSKSKRAWREPGWKNLEDYDDD